MRLVRIRYIVLALLLAVPASSFAQRVPDEGSMAAGAEFGFLASGDDDLTASPILGGFFGTVGVKWYF